jgi:hypothetical protein
LDATYYVGMLPMIAGAHVCAEPWHVHRTCSPFVANISAIPTIKARTLHACAYTDVKCHDNLVIRQTYLHDTGYLQLALMEANG